MARAYRIFLCGVDYERRQPRGDCPNTLHDWPLPDGYVEASEVADARLRARWANKKCPECGLYGWAPGNKRAGTHPVQVQLETKP